MVRLALFKVKRHGHGDNDCDVAPLSHGLLALCGGGSGHRRPRILFGGLAHRRALRHAFAAFAGPPDRLTRVPRTASHDIKEKARKVRTLRALSFTNSPSDQGNSATL